jgi:hypothetical protein
MQPPAPLADTGEQNDAATVPRACKWTTQEITYERLDVRSEQREPDRVHEAQERWLRTRQVACGDVVRSQTSGTIYKTPDWLAKSFF